MKYIHLVLYLFLNWAVKAFNPFADWFDEHFPIITEKKYNSTLGGAIGFWMIVRKCILYGICVKEGTVNDKHKLVQKKGIQPRDK